MVWARITPMANHDRDSKEKPPLPDYRPVRTGWQRTEELQDEELEQRGRVGVVVVAIVILILIFVFMFLRS